MHGSMNDSINGAAGVVEIKSGTEAAETDSTKLTGEEGTMPASAKTPGKFAPLPKSFKTMTTAELHDRTKELNTRLGNHNMSFTAYRRALGHALDEMRTRIAAADGRLVIQQGEPAVSWEGYCTMIGVSRRSAFNWAGNWKTISEAPENLVDAAGRAGIDLFRPKTANALKSIAKQYSDRILSDAELPALLERLEASGKRNSGASSKEPKVPIDPDPQEGTRNGVSVGDAQKFCSEVFEKLADEEKKANPMFFAFTNCAPSAPLQDVVRILFRYMVQFSPAGEQQAIAESIAEAAQAELDIIREKQTRQTTPVPPQRTEKRTIPIADICSEFKQLLETAISAADLTNESGLQLLAAFHTAATEESKLGFSLFLQPVEQLFDEYETGQGVDTDPTYDEATCDEASYGDLA
jgi:hypothetical protein